MALEQFKTQILLLHSEQSTLDKLSVGFADRYTVHCATSGSEALNTLGQTTIDVIVSAQELPGMSGLDALREAKKRSPETLGILLAGNNGEGVEALVGANEVFQIVRGGITPESLRNLIDNATRQARLVELTESANDTTADMDASAEHIVMETSENGASIITDATGRMPALNPEKYAEANVGSRAVDVLVLTKDEEFLTTVRESARGMHNIIAASTLAQADEAVATQTVGVAVVDAAMVGDNVEKLTAHLRTKSPRLVSIIAGRRDDGEMLMDLINRGKVYRFLLKPVSPGRARLAIEASAKHHMEAPDAAFKTAGSAAPARPAPKPSAKPIAKPAAAKPVPRAKPKSDTSASQPVPTIVVEPRPVPVEAQSFETDRLGDAFSGDDSSFTETMTGIIRSVGDKFSSSTSKDDDADEVAPVNVVESFDIGDSGDSLFSNPKILGIGAAALVAVLGLGWWLFSGSDEPTPASQTQQPRSASATQESAAASAATSRAGAISEEQVDDTLSRAESSLLAGNSADAAAALQSVSQVDPNNSRLPFLNAQLAQMQLREYLDAARVAIRDNRFEDAAVALNGARALDISDSSEIDVVSGELDTAMSEQRVDDVLARANIRLEDGKLTSPSNDNARYYYELALSNDPGNTAATQGLKVVASKLVLQARTEIDAGRFDSAELLLADARRLDPNSGELVSSTSALNAARNDSSLRQQQAAQRAEAERLAAERAAAEKLAAEEAAAAQTYAIAPTAADALTDEKTAIPSSLQAQDVVSDAGAQQPPQVEQQAPAPEELRPVAASSLTRTKYVAPKYPRSAQRRNLTGWVEVEFTVDIDGSVRGVSVVNSEPGLTFVNSAVKAVEAWKFEPVLENGVAVPKLAAVRMMFAVE